MSVVWIISAARNCLPWRANYRISRREITDLLQVNQISQKYLTSSRSAGFILYTSYDFPLIYAQNIPVASKFVSTHKTYWAEGAHNEFQQAITVNPLWPLSASSRGLLGTFVPTFRTNKHEESSYYQSLSGARRTMGLHQKSDACWTGSKIHLVGKKPLFARVAWIFEKY